MNQGLIPHRYAKAFYRFALEKGEDVKMYDVMKALHGAFVSEPKLSEAIANPFVSPDDKTRLIMTAAGPDAKTSKCFADFIALLHKNKRIEFMRLITLAYMDIYRKENNIYLVELITASDLPDEELMRLKNLVQKHLKGAKMEFSRSIDSDLIGGFVININSERLDASVSNELKQLRLNLLSK